MNQEEHYECRVALDVAIKICLKLSKNSFLRVPFKESIFQFFAGNWSVFFLVRGYQLVLSVFSVKISSLGVVKDVTRRSAVALCESVDRKIKTCR